MASLSGDVEFHFIQTMPMEEKRKNMGWAVDEASLPYLVLYYKEEAGAKELIEKSDVVLFGWTEGLISDVEKKRLSSGKLSFRISERIYREGQWKFVSPRGLASKYHEHFVYRDKPVYLLCTGAYVASDFNLIKSYPGKKLKWGYFPDASAAISDFDLIKSYPGKKLKRGGFPDASAVASGGENGETDCAGQVVNETAIADAPGNSIAKEVSSEVPVRLCWAGRLIELKHPEFAVKVASQLKKSGRDFVMDIVGDGPLRPALEDMVKSEGLEGLVTFTGAVAPGKVLSYMDRADVFLFTSNYLEGWGAVVNEAMERECAVVASLEAGAVPYLIEDGVNGLVYRNGSYEEFEKKVRFLVDNRDKISIYGRAAKMTIKSLWNAKNAAGELVRFCREYLAGEKPLPAPKGPMSVAEIIPAPGMLRTLQEKNHLE